MTEVRGWQCPSCSVTTNSQGIALSGSRAVSLHVAGKIKSGDPTHRQWATREVGEVIQALRYGSINTLADEIEPRVIDINRELEKLILHKLEERDANDEPNVLAYRYIANIEIPLHKCVRQALMEMYGEGEDEWWAKGVPMTIRKDCASRREESARREELYAHTYLIDLKTIVEKNRALFESRLHAVNKQANLQKEFLDGITKCNEIRNRVMHTMHPISEEDLSFLRQMRALVRIFVG